MKTLPAILLTSMSLVAFTLPAGAQSSSTAERSIYVPPPVGSHLGGGYVDTGARAKPKATSARQREDRALAQAMNKFDVSSTISVEGFNLASAAVAAQTRIPDATIKTQHAKTGLSFSDLLVANSLAEGSGKNFSEIVAMERQTGAWTPVIKRLRVSMNSIVARTRAAETSMKYAEARRRRREDQNKQDNGLGRANLGGNAPHPGAGSP